MLTDAYSILALQPWGWQVVIVTVLLGAAVVNLIAFVTVVSDLMESLPPTWNVRIRIAKRQQQRERDARVADLLGRFPTNQPSADALHVALMQTTGHVLPPQIVPFPRRVPR
jgi:hypothetical protein